MTIYCINICKHHKNIQKALSGKLYLCPSVASRNNNYNKSKTVSLQIALVAQCSGEIILYDISVGGEPKSRFYEMISELDENSFYIIAGNSGAPVSHFLGLYICIFLFLLLCSYVCMCVCVNMFTVAVLFLYIHFCCLSFLV